VLLKRLPLALPSRVLGGDPAVSLGSLAPRGEYRRPLGSLELRRVLLGEILEIELGGEGRSSVQRARLGERRRAAQLAAERRQQRQALERHRRASPAREG
jgi:hypothetical protein